MTDPSEVQLGQRFSTKWLQDSLIMLQEPFITAFDAQGKASWSIATLQKHRDRLLIQSHYYGQQLATIQPLHFQYFTLEQTTQTNKKLRSIFLSLAAQYQLRKSDDQRQTLLELRGQLLHCLFLLRRINQQHVGEITDLLSLYIDDSYRPVKYVWLRRYAPGLVEQIDNLRHGKAAQLLDWLQRADSDPLAYKNWRGSINNTLLAILPQSVPNYNNATGQFTARSTTPGYIGVAICYTRFLIQLIQLLKHVIKGPWMSQQEKNTPWRERLHGQWQQTKFTLPNDAIWGSINLICLLSLSGNPLLSPIVDIITTLALLTDTICNVLKWKEERAQYHRIMRELDEQLKKNTGNHEYQQELRAQQKLCELEWRYKKYQRYVSTVISIGTLMASILLCGLLISPLPIIAATMLVTLAATLCLILNLLNTAASDGLILIKNKEAHKINVKNWLNLQARFSTLQSAESFEKKHLYLQIKQLSATLDYERRLATFQQIKLICSIATIIVSILLGFATAVFLPMGIGLVVLSVGSALLILGNLLINVFEPKPPTHTLFIAKASNPTDEINLTEAKKLLGKGRAGLIICAEKLYHCDPSKQGDAITNITDSTLIQAVRESIDDIRTGKHRMATILELDTLAKYGIEPSQALNEIEYAQYVAANAATSERKLSLKPVESIGTLTQTLGLFSRPSQKRPQPLEEQPEIGLVPT